MLDGDIRKMSWIKLSDCEASPNYYMYDSQYMVFSQVFGTHQYSRPFICFTHFFNVTRENPNNLVLL